MKPARAGFFTWSPHSQSSWRWWFRPTLGHDEVGRRTVGLVTVAGSVFYAWPCGDADCLCHTEEGFE